MPLMAAAITTVTGIEKLTIKANDKINFVVAAR